MRTQFALALFTAGVFVFGPVLADKGDTEGNGRKGGEENGEQRDNGKHKTHDRKDNPKTEKSQKVEALKENSQTGKNDHFDGWNGCSPTYPPVRPG